MHGDIVLYKIPFNRYTDMKQRTAERWLFYNHFRIHDSVPSVYIYAKFEIIDFTINFHLCVNPEQREKTP